MTDPAIAAYYAERKETFELNHWSGRIVGVGKTIKLAKADAHRQAALVKIEKPHIVFKIKNKKVKRAWFKHRSHEPVQWYKAVKFLNEHISKSEIGKALQTSSVQVTSWAKKASVPPLAVRDDLCRLLDKHLTRTQICSCNLELPK